MRYPQVQRIQYSGEVWGGDQLSPRLAALLSGRDRLIVLGYGGPPYQVILGVPHHAAVGDDHICEDRLDESQTPDPRDADENAALYALAAFTTLKKLRIPSKLVIMAHATTHDPNKILDSPYCQAIFEEEGGLLFECHGSGARRRLALELSAGSNHLVRTVRFGGGLAAAFEHRYPLGVQKRAETREALIFRRDGSRGRGALELPATNTASLIEAEKRNIQALHLEAKPAFRKYPDASHLLTADGLILGRAIAQAVERYFS